MGFLTAESPAHTAGNDIHPVHGNVKHFSHQLLGFRGVLGGGMDGHAAIFRRFCDGGLTLQVEMLLATNTLGTKTTLLIAVGGFLMGRPDFLDLALLYALLNFSGTIAVLKFARFHSLAHHGDGE